jgi:hypothetical protein
VLHQRLTSRFPTCYHAGAKTLIGFDFATRHTGAMMACHPGQKGADHKMSIFALPPELLQHICSFLHDPDDLANCHLVDTRCMCSKTAYNFLVCKNSFSGTMLHSTMHVPRSNAHDWPLALTGSSCCAGCVRRQGVHCTVQSRSTRASLSWRCGTATRCATSAPLTCPPASWTDTLQRCNAVIWQPAS